MKAEEYYTETYITEWKDKDNVIISMWKQDLSTLNEVS